MPSSVTPLTTITVIMMYGNVEVKYTTYYIWKTRLVTCFRFSHSEWLAKHLETARNQGILSWYMCYYNKFTKIIKSHALPFPGMKCPWLAQESWQPSRARDTGRVAIQCSPYHQCHQTIQALRCWMNKWEKTCTYISLLDKHLRYLEALERN